MLLELKVRNWASFKDEVVLNTLATEEAQHTDHPSEVPSLGYKALPIAMLYGGNASGKTNLIKALAFLQNLVRRGIDIDGNLSSPIEPNPFILDKEYRTKPSMISVTFLSNGHVYEYSVEVGTIVHSEKLSIVSNNESKLIFSRKEQEIEMGDSPDFQLEVLSKFLDQVAPRQTQLFLNLAQSNATKVVPINDAFNWFVSLICVFPNQMLSQFVYNENPEFDRVISTLDTGVSQVKFSPIEPSDELKRFASEVSHSNPISFVLNDARFAFTYTDDGSLQIKKLYTTHKGYKGEDFPMDYRLESDGTKHVLDLVHAVMSLTKEGSNIVLIIDEIDRSLHPLMSMQLIRMFLEGRKPNATTQLIATCHNPLILDQQLLRRDEIWLLERDQVGASRMSSISDFMDVNDESDIQKLYFLGKLGGLPAFF